VSCSSVVSFMCISSIAHIGLSLQQRLGWVSSEANKEFYYGGGKEDGGRGAGRGVTVAGGGRGGSVIRLHGLLNTHDLLVLLDYWTRK